MHAESLQIMKQFAQSLNSQHNLKILDVGSYDVNGCYQPFFLNPAWEYVGVDIHAGPNVNMVVKDIPWPIADKSFDIVISGQTLEHVAEPLQWMKEVHRVLKPNGIAYILAPSAGNPHGEKHFKDYWRILPDGMEYLMKSVGFSHVSMSLNPGRWRDVVGRGVK